MPFVVNTERYLAPIDPPDPEPIDPFFWVAVSNADEHTPKQMFEDVTRVHFNADGVSAQCYNGDTAGIVMTVYNGVPKPPQEKDRSRMKVMKRSPGPTITSNVTIRTTGCDGIGFQQLTGEQNKKEAWCFTMPPTSPGKMVVSFNSSSGDQGVDLTVTTDYVPPPDPVIVYQDVMKTTPYPDPTEVGAGDLGPKDETGMTAGGKQWLFFFQDTYSNFNPTDSRVKVTAVSLKDSTGVSATPEEYQLIGGSYDFGEEHTLDQTRNFGFRWLRAPPSRYTDPSILMTLQFNITFTPGGPETAQSSTSEVHFSLPPVAPLEPPPEPT